MLAKTIVFTAPLEVALQDLEIAQPTGSRLLVKTAVSTLSSGTERANLLGDVDVNPTKAIELQKFPRYLGYSSAGEVVAVGEDVKNLAVGDRVAVFQKSRHASYTLPDEAHCLKIDRPDTPFSEAAMWFVGSFPLAAIRKCRLEIGESAIVMGLGMLGMIAVKLLRAAGAAPVIAVDPVPEKRAQALQNGADLALDPFAPDFTATVRQATGGGVNVAIEVTGNGKALDQVLDVMARFGRVALLGCTRKSDFTIDYYRKVHYPGITLVGAHTNARPGAESFAGYWTHHDDMNALQKLYECGRLSLSALVEETHSPAEAPAVYARLAHAPAFPLTQFDWGTI